MDYDEHSLNSMPTMGPGRDVSTKRPPFPDEPSLGSARTMGGRTTPPHGRFRPGDVLLGRYTVLAVLGEGGMGIVYKCMDTVGGIEVALKCLPPELSRNESEMEGIRENYAIVARLHHSAISGLRQLEKDPDFGEYYLVMDLAKGEDLSTILHRRRGAPMPLDEALAILRPLASALDYAHGEQVLHRDVKPANVKVDGKHIQLLDFGLAAEVRSSMSRVSLRGHTGSSGTPAYMAPEQWEARRQSAATDQYSLAVMAYEMLSGYRPFDTDNMELLKSAVLARAPEEIEGLPAHVNAALLKALAKNPKDRFASCTEFVESCFEPQRTQSPQRKEEGRADLRVGRNIDNVGYGRDGARPSPASAVSEADVLRRKLALTRSLKAISAEDRADNEFAKFVEKAKDELAVAEEACKLGRFAVAAESLNVAEKALFDLQTAKQAREEAERNAREEAERQAREEAERKVREAAERKAREEAARRAWKEARRKAKEEVREEAERKAREETERKMEVNTVRMDHSEASPVLLLSATVNHVEVSGATLSIWGQNIALPAKLELDYGTGFGPGDITFTDGNHIDYAATMGELQVDWRGERSVSVPLTVKGGNSGRMSGAFVLRTPLREESMSILRVILAIIFPPLAVIDRGWGSVLIVFLLTCIGWVPGVIAALVILNKKK